MGPTKVRKRGSDRVTKCNHWTRLAVFLCFTASAGVPVENERMEAVVDAVICIAKT